MGQLLPGCNVQKVEVAASGNKRCPSFRTQSCISLWNSATAPRFSRPNMPRAASSSLGPCIAEEIILAHFPMKMHYIFEGMLGAQFATINKFSRTVDNLACAVYADSVLTNSIVTQPRAQQFEAHGPSLAPRVVLVNREAFVEGVEQTVEASSSPFLLYSPISFLANAGMWVSARSPNARFVYR